MVLIQNAYKKSNVDLYKCSDMYRNKKKTII